MYVVSFDLSAARLGKVARNNESSSFSSNLEGNVRYLENALMHNDKTLKLIKSNGITSINNLCIANRMIKDLRTQLDDTNAKMRITFNSESPLQMQAKQLLKETKNLEHKITILRKHTEEFVQTTDVTINRLESESTKFQELADQLFTENQELRAKLSRKKDIVKDLKTKLVLISKWEIKTS